jgi:hypothetical protein
MKESKQGIEYGTIVVSKIKKDKNVRADYGNLQELAASIDEAGASGTPYSSQPTARRCWTATGGSRPS